MRLTVGMLAFLLAGTPAIAQDASQTESSAIPSDDSQRPLPGANSFAESQARAAIVRMGYGNVSTLVNDSQGIWRGTATKGENTVKVSVDYRGHVDAR